MYLKYWLQSDPFYLRFHSHYCSHLLVQHLHAYFNSHMYPSPKLVLVQWLFLFLLICSIMKKNKIIFCQCVCLCVSACVQIRQLSMMTTSVTRLKSMCTFKTSGGSIPPLHQTKNIWANTASIHNPRSSGCNGQTLKMAEGSSASPAVD